MSTELIINSSLPETRIALMENGEIQDMIIERAGDRGIVGNIYKGRVTRVLPGMQAAFVDIGLDKAAFLYVDDIHMHDSVMDEGGDGASPSDSEGEGEEEDSQGDAQHDLSARTAESTADGSGGEHPAEGQVPGEVTEGNSEEDDETPVEMGESPEGDGGDASDGTISKPDSEPAAVQTENKDSENKDGAQPARRGGGRNDRQRRPARGAAGAAGGGKWGRNSARRSGPQNRSWRGDAAGATPEGQNAKPEKGSEHDPATEQAPETYQTQLAETGDTGSDRSEVTETGNAPVRTERFREEGGPRGNSGVDHQKARNSFRQQRGRDRKIPASAPKRGYDRYSEARVNIQDLLKEGQEVLVQVSKDPIATKGARLTCHISLPGRHLVCMPTIDHVGISRRIERDDERRKLREYVIRNRNDLGFQNMGFIVRTASGGQDPEKWIRQDIEYLGRLWNEIKARVADAPAPSLVYEDLNVVIRSIRDWVNEDVDKIIVDSRYYFDELKQFADRFMPSIASKIEMYQGDIPIFDAYGISSELNRALERRVWLKSGGYIVIDQAEAMVCIDVNTGRFVGKKNLEDTILKTNLEAVDEIAYQLRLRNCGGIIIVDLIDMEKEENRRRVYRAFEASLRRDRARPTMVRMSELGLIEMTRKRTRDTMIRVLCQQCNHCEGRGYVKSTRTVLYEILREIERVGVERDIRKILVQAHPDVIDALATEERSTLDQLEQRIHKQVFLQAVVDYHMEQFEVIGDKTPQAFEVSFRSARQTLFRESQKTRRSMPVREVPRDDTRPVALPPIRALGPISSSLSSSANANSSSNSNSNSNASHSNSRSSHGGRPQQNQRSFEPREPRESRDQQRDHQPREQQPREQQPREQQQREPRNTDPDSIGNRSFSGPQGHSSHQSAPVSTLSSSAQDDLSEEDRLAYLRAQASQDAALSGVPRNGFPSTGGGSPNYRGGSGGGGGGGRNRDRNHRGGAGNGGRGGQRNQRNNRDFRGRSGGGGGGNGGSGGGHRFRDRGPGPGGGGMVAQASQNPQPQVSASGGADQGAKDRDGES